MKDLNKRKLIDELVLSISSHFDTTKLAFTGDYAISKWLEDNNREINTLTIDLRDIKDSVELRYYIVSFCADNNFDFDDSEFGSYNIKSIKILKNKECVFEVVVTLGDLSYGTTPYCTKDVSIPVYDTHRIILNKLRRTWSTDNINNIQDFVDVYKFAKKFTFHTSLLDHYSKRSSTFKEGYVLPNNSETTNKLRKYYIDFNTDVPFNELMSVYFAFAVDAYYLKKNGIWCPRDIAWRY